MRKLCALLLLLAPAIFAAEQQAIPRAEETIDVSIVNLDVIVTDKNGQRVHGLTKDDFNVLEDGKPQVISNFAAYIPVSSIADAKSGVAMPAALPATLAPKRERRTIAIFIESFRLPQAKVEPIFVAVKKTLHDMVAPGDQVLIATWNLHTVVRLDYTDDLAAMDRTLDAVLKESIGGMPDAMTMYRWQMDDLKDWAAETDAASASRGVKAQDVAGFIFGAEAHNAAMMERTWMRDEARGINSFISTMADQEGRKALILMTYRFSQVAGGMYFFENAKEPDLTSASDESRNSNYDLRDVLKQTANAHNVTIYAFYPPNLEESGTTDITLHRWPEPYTIGVANRVLKNEMDALKDLADATGGAAAWGAVDIANELPHIRDDFEDYYSLAYRVSARKDNRARSVSVKTKNAAYTVRTRREFVEKSDDGRIRDQVIAALYHEPSPAGITVNAQIGKAVSRQKYRFELPVSVRVPVNQFMTNDEGDAAKGAFTVYLVTGRYVGDASDITKRTIPFTVRDAEKAKDGYFTYDFTLSTDIATNRLAIAVYDEVSHDSGFARIDLPRMQ